MRKVLTYLLLLGSLIFAVSPLCAQNSQKEKKARLEKEIKLIDQRLKETEGKSRSALANLDLIKRKIAGRKELIRDSERLIDSLSRECTRKQKEVDLISRRLDTLSFYYNRLVRNAYKNRDSKIWYMYILASENIGQAFRRIGYLRNLSSQMNVQAEKIRQVRSELEVEKEKLLSLKTEAETLRQSRLKEVESLSRDEASSLQTIKKIKKDRVKYQKDLAAKKKQVDALNAEIKRMIRSASKGTATASKGKTVTPQIDYTLDKEFANNKGRLPWPVSGLVIGKFGQHFHPEFKNVIPPYNNGIDIATEKDAPVKAVFDGVVRHFTTQPGYNLCVLVQHGSYFTFYCKLKNLKVKIGDKVKTGDIIGSVCELGGESQLHFQLWKGDSPQNPELWLR